VSSVLKRYFGVEEWASIRHIVVSDAEN
jgi:hypothetical protein